MHAEYRKRLFSGRLSLLSAVALLCLFSSAGFLPGLTTVTAQQIDPSDLWYSAFVLMKEGEGKEREQKALAAYNKFLEAKRLFDAVARDHPDFHPSIVRYRRRELADKILTFKNYFKNGGASTGGLPQLADSGVTTGEATNSAAQSTSSTPSPAVKGAGDLSGGQNRALLTDSGGSRTLELPTRNPEFSTPRPQGGAVRPNAIARPQNSPENPQNTAKTQTNSDGASPFTDATRQIKQQFQQMEQRVKQMELQNANLNQQVSSREVKLRETEKRMAEAQKREQQLQRRFELLKNEKATDQNAVAQIASLKKHLSEALDALEKVNRQNREILRELEFTRTQLVGLREERDDLAKERDQLAVIIEGSGDSAQAVARLTDINLRLRKELTEARSYAESLAKDNGDKQIEVAVLKEKIAEIAEGRQDLIEENERHQTYIVELESRLKQMAKGVVEMDQGSSPEALEENRLLRGVVLRQLRRQAQIKQAREMILEQLDDLGVESEDLLASLDVISVTPGLTEDEKKLFREPQVADLIQGGAQLHGAILVEGSGKARKIDQQEVTVQDLSEELAQLQKVGRLDFSEGRYREAARAYRKILNYAPNDVDGICNLATVQIQLNEYEAAEKLLEKSLTHEKQNGRVYYLLGVVHFERGNLDDALKRFDEGLKINPENAKALNCVGVISSKKGWRDRAEKSFTKAVSIKPDYADAHFNLSILYTTGKKPDRKKGEKHYRRAIDLGLPRDAKIEQVLNS